MSSKYAILKFYEQALMYIFDALGDRVTNNVQLDKLGKLYLVLIIWVHFLQMNFLSTSEKVNVLF